MVYKVTVKDDKDQPVMGMFVTANDEMNGLTFSRSTDGNGYADLAVPGFLPGHRVTLSVLDPQMRYKGVVMGDALEVTGHDQELAVAVSPFKRPAGNKDKLNGLVHNSGRVWLDASGPVRPRGGTLFWAMSGQHDPTDRERLAQNVGYLASKGGQYMRMLGTFVNVDLNWPDYVQTMADVIDMAYDKGVATEITCHGGGNIDHRRLANNVVAAVRGREHKVIGIECVNEMYSTWPGHEAQMKEMAEILRQLPHLIAPSSPGDQQISSMTNLMRSGPYTYGTVHKQRNAGDRNWRFVRQSWDYQAALWPISNNEPIGPSSSVNQCIDPCRLAMDRAVGILCGIGAYVLHNANGIYGYYNVNPHGGYVRNPNLWEIQNADQIYDVVFNVHTLIPEGIENWTNANDGWTPPNPVHPLPTTTFWGDGINAAFGTNKNYAAINGDQFVCMPCGVLNHADFKARYDCFVRVFNPVIRSLVLEQSLNAGEVLQLVGDGNADTAYIIQGERR